MTEDSVDARRSVRGRIGLLDGEVVSTALEIEKMTLTLTTERVIVSGEEWRLWFFDGPRAARAVFLDDLTVISTSTKFLPSWLALVGAALVLYALVGGLRENFFALVLGVALVGIWYVVKTEVLELKVGADSFALVPIRTPTTEAAGSIDRFVDGVFRAKAARLTGGSRARSAV